MKPVISGVESEQFSIDAARSDLAVLEARERLNVLLGLWGQDIEWTLPNELPDPPANELSLDQLESLAVRQRLDLAAARRQLDVAADVIGLTERWRYLGSLEVGVDSEREDDGAWFVGPGVSLELPIFDQGDAEIARHQALFRQAERRHEALAVDIRSEVRSARSRLVAARHLTSHHRDVILPLQKQRVDLALKDHKFALIGAFELLEVKQDEIGAEVDHAEALKDYWMARVDLEHAVGGALVERPQSSDSPAILPEHNQSKGS